MTSETQLTVSVYADQLVVTSVTQLTVSVCRSVGRDIGDLFVSVWRSAGHDFADSVGCFTDRDLIDPVAYFSMQISLS